MVGTTNWACVFKTASFSSVRYYSRFNGL